MRENMPHRNLDKRHLVGEMTWPEAEKFREVDVAICRSARSNSTPHLPLDTDSFDADYLAKKAENCSDPKPVVCCRSFLTACPIITMNTKHHQREQRNVVQICV